MVSGVSKQASIDILESAGIDTNGTIRVVVPQVYVYLGDGYVVDYEVNRVYVGSCSYWEVVPYTLFTPRYVVIDLLGQYYEERCTSSCNNAGVDHALDMVKYSTRAQTLLDGTVDASIGSPILEDTSTISSSYEVSGSIVNIYKELIEIILEAILGTGNPVYDYMVSLYMDQFSYTYHLYSDQGADYLMELYSSGEFNDVYVRVDKYTSRIGPPGPGGSMAPLHIDYKVYVDVYP